MPREKKGMSHRTVRCQEEVRAPHSVQGLCEGGLRLLEDCVSLERAVHTVVGASSFIS